MESVRLSHPFQPLVSPDSHILILGSFPSVKSREQQFFYGHPQNRFWPMLAAVFDAPVPLSIAEKTNLILSHGLALWDSIGACTITGSSDASIRDPEPVDIRAVTDVAAIRRVLCNGSLSGKLYRRHLQPKLSLEAWVMPSTSPANASWSLSKLTEVWEKALTLD